MRRFYWLFMVILLAGALAACTARQEDRLEEALADLQGPHTEVTIQNLSSGPAEELEGEFSPPTVIIPPGGTVVWISQDTGPHSVTEGTPGEEDSAFDYEVPPGGFVMFTFNDTGEYTYYCRYHEHEVGEVSVQTANP